MLVRTAAAGLRARTSCPPLPRSGILWSISRGLAHDNRPPSSPRTTSEVPRPKKIIPKSAESSFKPSHDTLEARLSSEAISRSNVDGAEATTSQYSDSQVEFQTRSNPNQNAVPHSGAGRIDIKQARGSTPGSATQFSELQEELKTPSTPEGNTPPQPPPSADNTATSDSSHSPPLHDLTKGIPSSFEAGGTTAALGLHSESDGSPPTSARGGGKGGGELPRSAYISSIERRRNRIANYVFATFLLLAATGTIYLGRNWESEEEEKKHADAPSGWGLKLFYNRALARLSDSKGYYTEPAFPKLLPNVDPAFERPYTLVLSLEDLLVHSEWTREHGWRMAKRPGVDYFLRYLQQYYELVIFTSAPMMMAEPVIRKLDPYRIVMWPLFREATKYVNGEHIKDLSYLNRDLSKVILIDTDPGHARLQPENAIILPKWNGDPKDRELVALIPFLEYVAAMGLTDTRQVLKSYKDKHIPSEFAARELIARKKFEEMMAKERSHRPHRIGKSLVSSVMGGRGGMGGDGLEQSAVEAFEQGKMLQDHIRERGQKQYEALEREIRENGEKWLKEMQAEDDKMRDEQMQGMRTSLASFFTSRGQPPPEGKS